MYGHAFEWTRRCDEVENDVGLKWIVDGYYDVITRVGPELQQLPTSKTSKHSKGRNLHHHH